MNTADFDFDLPEAQIATVPAARRDASRLLVLDREGNGLKHVRFHDIARHLPPRSLLVLNDTRVFPARLRTRKPTGGAVEFLLTRSASAAESVDGGVRQLWEALARGLGGAGSATEFEVGPHLRVALLERREAGAVLVRLESRGPRSILEALEVAGEVPLPPYIETARRRASEAGAPQPPPAPGMDDRERYQTVYATAPGAVAAPTAGLHFTPDLLEGVRAAGHDIATVTLHVGPGTFRPVGTDDPRAHRMDAEHYHVPAGTADAIAAARAEGRPVVAVGTTVVRTLEAAARADGSEGQVRAGDGATDLMILPGDRFAVVDALITNFHLPRSTLLMLVAAFTGREAILAAYREAIAEGYRFYSYGDAMLIRPGASGSAAGGVA